MEYVGLQHRAKLGAGLEFAWSISAMAQPWIFYLVLDFQLMQFLVVGYEALACLGLVFMWESPRWLLANGHYAKARSLILAAAAEKGNLSTEQIEGKLERLKVFASSEREECAEKRQSLCDVYKDPGLLRNCLLLYFIWFAMSFMNYGVGLNIGDLGGSLFLNFFVISASGFCVQVFLIFFVDRVSRRSLLFGSYALSAVFFFAMASVTSLAPIFMTVFAFAAAGGMNVFYIINYVYAAENFPTTVRQIAMGSCGFVSRLGAISAPFMRELASSKLNCLNLSSNAPTTHNIRCFHKVPILISILF